MREAKFERGQAIMIEDGRQCWIYGEITGVYWSTISKTWRYSFQVHLGKDIIYDMPEKYIYAQRDEAAEERAGL